MFFNVESEIFNTRVKFSVAFPAAPAPTGMVSNQVSLKSPDGTNFTITEAEAARLGFVTAATEKLLSTTPIEIPLSDVSNKALEILVNYLKGPAGAESDSEVNKKLAEEFVSELETPDLFDLASTATILKLEGVKRLACAEIDKRRSNR